MKAAGLFSLELIAFISDGSLEISHRAFILLNTLIYP